MRVRIRLRQLAVLAALFLVACGPKPERPAATNLLLITLDTTRADFIGCYGFGNSVTPNLDQLAGEGTLFANHVATSQTTNPSHASILTGLYPSEHRLLDNRSKLSEAAVSIAEVLRDQDFMTLAAVSAKHLNPSNSAFDQGFHQFLECDGTQMTARERNERFLDALDEVIPQSPFFAWVHYFDPHWPYTPPGKFARMHDLEDTWDLIPHPHTKENRDDVDPDEYIRDYRAEVTFLDAEIARVLSLLEKRGVKDETIIIVVADHGESLMEKDIRFRHAGLYNQVTHVPMILRYPPEVPQGETVSGLTSSVDIAPTILDLLKVEAEVAGRGSSLRSVWREPTKDLHPFVYSEAHKGVIRAVYDGEYKYIKPYSTDWSMPAHRLYRDPRQDYWEENDLVNDLPEKAQALAGQLDRFIEECELTALPAVTDHEVDPETQEALKALGYVGGR